MRTLLLLLFLTATATAAEKDPDELLAALTPPVPGMNQPDLPDPPKRVLDSAGREMAHSRDVRQAIDDLNPKNSNLSWFAAEDVLEREHAVWCLQVCLCFRHRDVQIRAVRALTRLKDKAAVPFLLEFAEYEDAHPQIIGSESVTMYDILIHDIKGALSTLTGVPSSTDEKDKHPFTSDILRWRKWQTDHPDGGA